MNWLSWITLVTFLVAGGLFVLGLIVWLVTMALDKNPLWPRRVTLTAFGFALAALITNAFFFF